MTEPVFLNWWVETQFWKGILKYTYLWRASWDFILQTLLLNNFNDWLARHDRKWTSVFMLVN